MKKIFMCLGFSFFAIACREKSSFDDQESDYLKAVEMIATGINYDTVLAMSYLKNVLVDDPFDEGVPRLKK